MPSKLPTFLFLATSLSAQHWTSLKTPRFEMYTTKEQGPAVQELQYLESISSFFAATRPFGDIGKARPVQVITFRSSGEFAPYSFRAEGGGYYVHTYKNDYILIGDIGSRDRALVGHEFTHMVVTQAGLKLPIWLNEGLADFYSTVEINGKQATVGHAPVRYMETVHRQQWIPWDTLFAVDGASNIYNQSGNLAILYAQSWALTHMLEMDARYSGHFQQFLMAVSAGKATKEALLAVYHQTMADVDADLSVYIKGRNLPVMVLDCSPEAALPTPAISEAADFDVQFALASVLASKSGTGSEGRDKLAALSARYPERPEPEEEMGMLALQQNKKEDAQLHLALAVRRHSKDAQVLFNDGVLEKEAGAKYPVVSALYRRALEIEPDLDEARLELGFLEYEDFQYKSSLSLLSSVASIPDDSRFQIYFVMAQCYANLDESAKAETYVKKAAQAARTDDEKQQSAELLESVLRDEGATVAPGETMAAVSPYKPEPKLTNVRGLAKILHCTGGQRILGIEVDGREMLFDIDDPHLVVRHPNEDYSHWSCGPLKGVPLTIVYRPQTDPSGAGHPADGKAFELVF